MAPEDIEREPLLRGTGRAAGSFKRRQSKPKHSNTEDDGIFHQTPAQRCVASGVFPSYVHTCLNASFVSFNGREEMEKQMRESLRRRHDPVSTLPSQSPLETDATVQRQHVQSWDVLCFQTEGAGGGRHGARHVQNDERDDGVTLSAHRNLYCMNILNLMR